MKSLFILAVCFFSTASYAHCEKILNCEIRSKAYQFTAKSCHSADSIEIFKGASTALADYDARFTRLPGISDEIVGKNALLTIFNLPAEPLYMDQNFYLGTYSGSLEAGKTVSELPVVCTFDGNQ